MFNMNLKQPDNSLDFELILNNRSEHQTAHNCCIKSDEKMITAFIVNLKLIDKC